jgi:hypothetical protein
MGRNHDQCFKDRMTGKDTWVRAPKLLDSNMYSNFSSYMVGEFLKDMQMN